MLTFQGVVFVHFELKHVSYLEIFWLKTDWNSLKIEIDLGAYFIPRSNFDLFHAPKVIFKFKIRRGPFQQVQLYWHPCCSRGRSLKVQQGFEVSVLPIGANFFHQIFTPQETHGPKSINFHGAWENKIKKRNERLLASSTKKYQAENAWCKISHRHLQNKMKTKITNQLFKANCMVQINQQPGASAKPIRTIDWILFLRL